MLCNVARLRELMGREGLDAIVSTTFENVLYLSDFGNPLPYQTGTAAAAVVCLDPGAPSSLVVGMPYVAHLVEEPTWLSRTGVFGSITVESTDPESLAFPEDAVRAGLDAVGSSAAPTLAAGVLSALAAAGLSGGRVGFDPVTFAGALGADFTGVPVDGRDLLLRARAVKTPAEVDRLRRACAINEAAFLACTDQLKVGGDWRDVTLSWFTSWAAQGGTGAFWGGGAGRHASQFYPVGTSYPMGADDLVRFEGGGHLEGYWADTGRSGVIGTPGARQRTYAQALLAGAEAARELIRPGSTGDEICGAALAAIRANGIPHFQPSNVWGHGIGLALNELPRVRPGVPGALEPGMVICFETPYFELGWGGLQLEDTYLITETGHERLSAMSPDIIVAGG
jgi:Xaa-Pro dipeptidase